MKISFKKKKLIAYQHIMRIDKPIGTCLLMWPTLWALWITTSSIPPLWILLVFITGVWLMRTAGCVFNDYVDRKFDGRVKRTACRPLPNGNITEKEACLLFITLLLFSSFLVLTLNIMTIKLSIVALIITCVYPFMKRYTYLPQVILGIAFSWSILMSFAAVSETLPLSCWIMFLANILWTIAYDTQYAMIDRDDDIKIGIKSTAILFGEQDKLIVALLQIAMIALMIIIGYLNNLNVIYYLTIIVSSILFIYQRILLSNRNRSSYLKAFISNNYVGFIIFLGLVMNFH